MLRPVLDTGLLPPAQTRKGSWELHTIHYLCSYGFFSCKQHSCSLSAIGFHNGGVLACAVKEVPYSILFYLRISPSVDGSDNLVYTSAKHIFGYA